MKKKFWPENWWVLPLLAGYAWMILRLYFTGRINFYIHPDFTVLAVITGIVLVLLFACIAIFSVAGRGALPHHVHGKWWQLMLVIIPLLLALLLPPQPLSSQAFSSRSVDNLVELALSRKVKKPAQFVLNSENRDLADWVRLFGQQTDLSVYAGMKAKVTGFVLRDGNLPDGYFTVARFVISCCAADARPVGLLVRYNLGLYTPVNDQWVEIRGEWQLEEVNGQIQPVLILKEAQKIDIPANPYIS